jgi:rod shape-determining protein MreD
MRRLIVSVALLAAALVIQVSAVNQVALPGGGVPDLVLLTVIVLAVTGGPVTGMVTGFAAGLCLDIAPPGSYVIGQYALVFCLIGYASGRLGRAAGLDGPGQRPAPAAVVLLAVGAAAGEAATAALGKAIGDPQVSAAVVRHVLPSSVAYDLIASPVVLYLVTWVLALATRSRLDRDLDRAAQPGPAGARVAAGAPGLPGGSGLLGGAGWLAGPLGSRSARRVAARQVPRLRVGDRHPGGRLPASAARPARRQPTVAMPRGAAFAGSRTALGAVRPGPRPGRGPRGAVFAGSRTAARPARPGYQPGRGPRGAAFSQRRPATGGRAPGGPARRRNAATFRPARGTRGGSAPSRWPAPVLPGTRAAPVLPRAGGAPRLHGLRGSGVLGSPRIAGDGRRHPATPRFRAGHLPARFGHAGPARAAARRPGLRLWPAHRPAEPRFRAAASLVGQAGWQRAEPRFRASPSLARQAGWRRAEPRFRSSTSLRGGTAWRRAEPRFRAAGSHGALTGLSRHRPGKQARFSAGRSALFSVWTGGRLGSRSNVWRIGSARRLRGLS